MKKEYVQIRKELSAGAYPLHAFYLARTTAQLPIDLLWTVVNIPALYWMGNVNPDMVSFTAFFFLIWLHVLVQESIGLAISSGVPASASLTVALLVMAFMFTAGQSSCTKTHAHYFSAHTHTYTGGLFVRLDQFGWLSWVKYANPLTYAFQGGMGICFSQRSGIEFACDPALSSFEVCANMTANATAGAFITGPEVQLSFGIDLGVGTCILVMCVWALVMRVLGYWGLYNTFVSDGTLDYACCPNGICGSPDDLEAADSDEVPSPLDVEGPGIDVTAAVQRQNAQLLQMGLLGADEKSNSGLLKHASARAFSLNTTTAPLNLALIYHALLYHLQQYCGSSSHACCQNRRFQRGTRPGQTHSPKGRRGWYYLGL